MFRNLHHPRRTYQLIAGFLPFVALAALLVVFEPLPQWLSGLFMIPFMLLLPGYLVLLNITKQRIRFAPLVIFSLLLSLLVIMATGYLGNLVLPELGWNDPLRPEKFSAVFLPVIFLLFVGATRGRRSLGSFNALAYHGGFQATLGHIGRYLVPPLVALLALVGALTLNNGGSNVITMLSIVGAIGVAIWAFRSQDESFKKWSLYFIGLSVLLMLSMRSYYIAGSDISKEFQLLTNTLNDSLWKVAANNDPYSACLSITVLPALIYHMLGIAPELIFKLLYQLFFAFLPVVTYLFTRRFFGPKFALLAGLLLVAQPWFIDPMVTLMRQEISLLFFGGIVIALFDGEFDRRRRVALFILLGSGLVLSHYSTAYVTLFLLLALLPFARIFTGQWHIRGIRFITILILLLFTFLWNTQLTGSSSNLGIVIRETFKSIPSAFSTDQRSTIVSQLFNLGEAKTSGLDFSAEAGRIRSDVAKTNPYLTPYPENAYKSYELASTEKGLTNPPKEPWYTLVSHGFKGILLILGVGTIVGAVHLWHRSRHEEKFREYMPVVIVGLLANAVMIALPYVSKAYNFDRLYMQTYILLAPITVVGVYFLLSRIIKKKRLAIAGVLLIVAITFLYTKGLMWQVVGGKADMWLNNHGSTYSIVYVHRGEVLSAQWMLQRADPSQLIYTNTAGGNILTAYSDERVIDRMVASTFPQAITRESYVYLPNSVVQHGVSFHYYRATNIAYPYPTDFLRDNKNKLYSNDNSAIYK